MRELASNRQIKAAFTPSRRGRLLQCAAASAAAWVLATTAAHAAIPPECDEEMNPNIITCELPAPGTLDAVDITQGNTTIVIGTPDVPTDLETNVVDETGVFLGGDGSQTVLVGAGSTVISGDGQGVHILGNGNLSVLTGTGSRVESELTGIVVRGEGAVSVNAMGDVVSNGLNGISGTNLGAGSVTITTSGLVSADNFGVGATNASPDGSDVVVDTSAGTVSGSFVAIRAVNDGSGVLSVTTGDVVSSGPVGGIGISAETWGTDALIDTTAGTIDAEGRAINLLHDGTGDARITVGDINADTEEGIRVFAQEQSRDVIINTQAGTIAAGEDGIEVRHIGSGIVVIETANVTSETENGILLETTGSSALIDTSAGSVSAETAGILATHMGNGTLAIDTGRVTSATSAGILATNESGTDTVINSNGGVTGLTAGFWVTHEGSGGLSITTSDITATGGAPIVIVGPLGGSLNGDGIFARVSDASSGPFDIDTSGGSIRAFGTGIDALNNGSGTLSVTSANITSIEDDGILARSGALSQGIVIDSSAGGVSGAQSGIVAEHDGTGLLSVTTADVSGSTEEGIFAFSANGDGVFVDSSAGTVTGGMSGIVADNAGFGTLEVITADVTGANGNGISASNNPVAQSIRIDSTAGTVSGSTNGIQVTNAGNGSLTIDAANVIGLDGDGIIALNSVGGLVAIDTRDGSVTGSQDGIDATNVASGSLVIQTASVTGQGGLGSDGIFASNSTGGEVAITTADGVVTGGAGISVFQAAASSVSVTTGDVTGTDAHGILVRTNSSESTNVSVDTSNGAIRAATDGIDANHAGVGPLTVFAANVTAVGATGILASNDVNGSDVQIDSSAGAVFGGTVGIQAANFGSGALFVSTADVRGNSEDGVVAGNSAAGTDLTIDTSAGSVSAASDGLVALNLGSGALSIRTADVMGEGAEGIEANNGPDGSDLVIDSSAGAVTGQEMGIAAFNEGSGVTSVVTADVTGVENEGIAVANTVNGTSFMIDSRAGAVSGGTYGIKATHDGSGALLIQTAQVLGLDGDGIAANASGDTGAFTIDSTAGLVAGEQSGINAFYSGTADGLIQTGDVTGAIEAGITTFSAGDNFLIDSSAGSVFGGQTGIVATHIGAGGLAVVSGEVVGEAGAGIRASNSGTSLMIDSRAGTVTGGTNGIEAFNDGSSSASVVSGDVTGNDGVGIQLANSGLEAFLDTTAGTVTGAEQAILAENANGSLTILAADLTSSGAVGLQALNLGDASFLTIDTSRGTVTALGNGIDAQNQGSGSVSVTSADVRSVEASGILVFNSANGTDLSIDGSAGSVSGAVSGILAANEGSGSLLITAANVSGAASIGIDASNSAAGVDLTIDSSAGAVEGGVTGILAVNDGSGLTSLVTSSVRSDTLDAIAVSNTEAGTSLFVDTRTGDVVGAQNGINALNNGSSSASIMTGNVTGNSGEGIKLVANGLETLIDTTAGTVASSNNAIDAINSGGSLTILTGELNAAGAAGLFAENTDGATFLAIDTSAGSVTGNTNGIDADHAGSGVLSIRTADVTGTNSAGIIAQSRVGSTDLNIDTTAGQVSGNFFGIFADNEGAGDLTLTTGAVTSAQSAAVFAGNEETAANLIVDTTQGAISGATDGLRVRASGLGDVTIRTGDASGSMGDGIDVSNGEASGDILIDASAGSVSGGNDGIFARQRSSGLLSITTGDVSAANNAVVLEASGGDTRIVNQGTLESGGFEIVATDNSTGRILVENNGVITGNIDLADAADEFINNGVFNAIGNSSFVGGEDAFVNLGQVALTGQVLFSSLEGFNNSGTVSLANGVLGDTLQLSGDYLGSGGRLELDVNLSGVGETDVLVVDGVATGSTSIVLTTQGQIESLGASILLVDAGAGTSSDAFALLGDQIISEGFINIALTFDAANSDFLLESAVGPGVFRALKIGEGAQSIWYRSADAWSAHVDSKRHAAEVQRRPIWMQLYGSTNERDDRFGFTSRSFTQDISLGYSQDFFGFQLGVEFGPGSAGDAVFYGLSAGYLSSDLGFEGLADGVRYDAFNLGAYAGYAKDGLFAHGLVKYDFINADIDGQSLGYRADADGGSIGVRAEAGYRWESGRFFLEPSASLEYQSTDLDDFSVLGADFDLDRVEGLRGMAGLRLGGESQVNGGSKLTYYASGHAVHEFDGEGEITFSTPTASQTLINNPIGTYARVDLGLNIATKGGVTGFIEGNADLSGDFTSFGGRAGLRITF